MIRAEPATRLPVDVAKELRDALGRRQKELPPRWLAAYAATAVRKTPLPRHTFERAERDLSLTIVTQSLADLRPRAVVCVQPSASRVARVLVEALGERGTLSTVAAAELDP